MPQCVDDLIYVIRPYWHPSHNRPSQGLGPLEEALGRALPTDLKAFLLWSGGGQGCFPEGYVQLWEPAAIVPLNQGYQVQRYLGPDVVGFGTDGGPTLLALDYRTGLSPTVAAVDLGDLDTSCMKEVAPDFSTLLRKYLSGDITNRNLFP